MVLPIQADTTEMRRNALPECADVLFVKPSGTSLRSTTLFG